MISRNHCVFKQKADGQWTVTDNKVQKDNGTQQNSQMQNVECTLKIWFGNLKILEIQ